MKTYKQPDAREAEQFWSKIGQPREHNKKAEWIRNKVKKLKGHEEGLKEGNTHRFHENDTKRISNGKTLGHYGF